MHIAVDRCGCVDRIVTELRSSVSALDGLHLEPDRSWRVGRRGSSAPNRPLCFGTQHHLVDSGQPPPADDEHRRLVAELNTLAAAAPGRQTNAPGNATPAAASCCPANADRLLDPGSPFLELARWPLAACVATNPRARESSLDRPISDASVIVANDDGQGRYLSPDDGHKHLRAQEVALQNMLSCIYLVDSGGAFLPRQDEVFPPRYFGRIFYNHDDERQGHSAGGGDSALAGGAMCRRW